MEAVPEGGSATSTLPGTSFNSDFDSQIEVRKREHTIFGNGAVLNSGQSSALNFMWFVDVGKCRFVDFSATGANIHTRFDILLGIGTGASRFSN